MRRPREHKGKLCEVSAPFTLKTDIKQSWFVLRGKLKGLKKKKKDAPFHS